MKVLKNLIVLFALVVFTACSSTQSLQEYYVDNAENPNFLSIDLPVSLLNMDKTSLTAKQKDALHSFEKVNVLAFKKSKTNVSEFQIEKSKVKAILKDEKFNDLMKMNTPYGKATISYLGEDDAVDEVIIYGDSDKKGFMLIRVLGENMNPASIAQLMQALQKSDYNGEGLEQLEALFKA